MTQTNQQNHNMPFWNHLEELRKRIFRVLLVFVVVLGICAFFSKDLFEFLKSPLQAYLTSNTYFIATTPLGGWFVYLKVTLLSSSVFIFPYFLFEILRFITPGLYDNEKKSVIPLTLLMSVFFLSGLIFAFYLVLPIVLQFLVQLYDGTDIHFLPNIEDYFSFVIKILFGFGLLFLLPFLVLFLLRIKVVQVYQLTKARPFIYASSFIMGALLTPPDVISQMLMAIPFIVLFEFGFLLGKVFIGERTVSSDSE